jgi:hypothetical protein
MGTDLAKSQFRGGFLTFTLHANTASATAFSASALILRDFITGKASILHRTLLLKRARRKKFGLPGAYLPAQGPTTDRYTRFSGSEDDPLGA